MKKLVQAAIVLAAAATVGSFGCGNMIADDSKLTRHQRDSVIAKSALPGAAVVGRALEEADSARARAERDMP
jgi:hypothetical protein